MAIDRFMEKVALSKRKTMPNGILEKLIKEHNPDDTAKVLENYISETETKKKLKDTVKEIKKGK